MNSEILRGVEKYYTDKVKVHGTLATGVDWNSTESQYLRFRQLSKVIDFSGPFSILDYGCGYGEYLNFLEKDHDDYKLSNYVGFDISKEMISQARDLFSDWTNVSFTSEMDKLEPSDFLIASGLFNVKMDLATDHKWYDYMIEMINLFNSYATKGFAFNALTVYSDEEYMKDYLYYSDPLALFDFCKKNFSRNVALLHDYDLYEFTILVRK